MSWNTVTVTRVCFTLILVTAFLHCSFGKHLRIAWVVPDSKFHETVNSDNSAGALRLALDVVSKNNRILYGNSIAVKQFPVDCEITSIITTMLSLRKSYSPDVIIGPPCQTDFKTVGLLAADWNIPVFSWHNIGSEFDNASRYPTLIRLIPSTSALTTVLMEVLKDSKEKHITLLYYQAEPWSLLHEALKRQTQKKGRFLLTSRPVRTGISELEIRALLSSIKGRSSVVVLACPRDVIREIMLAARREGMADGRHVFVRLDPEIHADNLLSDNGWRRGDRQDTKARMAFKHLTHIAFDPIYDTSTPPKSTPTNRYADFTNLIQTSKRVYNPNWELAVGGKPDVYSMFLYDAFLLWAAVADALIKSHSNYRNGRLVADTIKSFRAQGATGFISFNQNMDRHSKVFVLNMARGGKFEPTAIYRTSNTGMEVFQLPPSNGNNRTLDRVSKTDTSTNTPNVKQSDRVNKQLGELRKHTRGPEIPQSRPIKPQRAERIPVTRNPDIKVSHSIKSALEKPPQPILQVQPVVKEAKQMKSKSKDNQIKPKENGLGKQKAKRPSDSKTSVQSQKTPPLIDLPKQSSTPTQRPKQSRVINIPVPSAIKVNRKAKTDSVNALNKSKVGEGVNTNVTSKAETVPTTKRVNNEPTALSDTISLKTTNFKDITTKGVPSEKHELKSLMPKEHQLNTTTWGQKKIAKITKGIAKETNNLRSNLKTKQTNHLQDVANVVTTTSQIQQKVQQDINKNIDTARNYEKTNLLQSQNEVKKKQSYTAQVIPTKQPNSIQNSNDNSSTINPQQDVVSTQNSKDSSSPVAVGNGKDKLVKDGGNSNSATTTTKRKGSSPAIPLSHITVSSTPTFSSTTSSTRPGKPYSPIMPTVSNTTMTHRSSTLSTTPATPALKVTSTPTRPTIGITTRASTISTKPTHTTLGKVNNASTKSTPKTTKSATSNKPTQFASYKSSSTQNASSTSKTSTTVSANTPTSEATSSVSSIASSSSTTPTKPPTQTTRTTSTPPRVATTQYRPVTRPRRREPAYITRRRNRARRNRRRWQRMMRERYESMVNNIREELGLPDLQKQREMMNDYMAENPHLFPPTTTATTTTTAFPTTIRQTTPKGPISIRKKIIVIDTSKLGVAGAGNNIDTLVKHIASKLLKHLSTTRSNGTTTTTPLPTTTTTRFTTTDYIPTEEPWWMA